MEKALTYNDVALLPDNYSDLETRDDADVSVSFLGKTYTNPVICANISSGLCETSRIGRRYTTYEW